MSSRAELPKNKEMDDHRDLVRATVIEYLRDKTTRDERKEIIKESLNEWLDKKAADLGWMSFRMLIYALLAAVAYLWLMNFGASTIKPH